MKYLYILIITSTILLTISCEKDKFPIRKPLIIQSHIYDLSINGITKEKYILDTNHNLISATIYDDNSQVINHETFEYYADNKIKYSLKYHGNSTTIFDTVHYTYTSGIITEIHESAADYTIKYTPNGEIDNIAIIAGACGCDHQFNYNDNNVVNKYHTTLSGYIADTMQYDNYKNIYKTFWPFDFTNPKYISANNTTEYKSIRVEDIIPN